MENKGLKVQIRGGFADRNNIHPVNTQVQYESLNDRTRTAFVNIINAMFHTIFKSDFTERNQFWRNILRDVYSQQIDCNPDISYKTSSMFEIINNTIYEDDYANVLSMIEYIAKLFHKKAHYPGQSEVYDIFNDVLKTEFVGYRFVNGCIVQITSDIEISQIEEATKIKENKIDEHINKALNLLADHEKPDYENSVKESISAVEAMCNEILGKKTTLGNALKQLKTGTAIHPVLECAFEKLYGYTSDASGIRHAGQIGGPETTFEEAKFMLVACSAFVNYLKGIQSKG